MAHDVQVSAVKGASETVKVNLPVELVDRLRAYAKRRNVAVGVLIRMMLSASMENE